MSLNGFPVHHNGLISANCKSLQLRASVQWLVFSVQWLVFSGQWSVVQCWRGLLSFDLLFTNCNLAISRSRNLALSQSRNLALSQSRNFAISQLRNLALSQSRNLATSQSRNLAFMSRWGKRLPRCPVCLREASRDDRNRERLRHRGECLRQSLPEMRSVRDIPPDSFFFGFRQIA